MDYKKLCPIINAVGVIVMFIWGVFGDDWKHSWIAVCIGGIISGLVYYLGKNQEKGQKKD